MEGAYVKLMILGLVLGSMMAAANGQLGGSSICGLTREGMESCKPAVTGLNPSPPSPLCCLALSNADLPCLCTFRKSKLLSDKFGINFARAMELPALCKIDESFSC